MTRILLVVFDGLRPDMVGPADTPHLAAFIGEGTRFSHARSVFPSETRVCSASIATGCLPRRHGLVANRIAHPRQPGRGIDTGHMAQLITLEQEGGEPLLGVPTLASHLAAAGREMAVWSTGTTGQTYLLNPEADALGHVRLSAHGEAFCSAAGRTLLRRLPSPPDAPAERAVWLLDTWRAHGLADPADVTVLWLCEPDTSGHYDGLGSPAQRAKLAAADAAFGRLVADWRAGPWRDELVIMVASDHGHASITGNHAIAPALMGSLAEGAAVMAGSSCGLVPPDPTPERIAAIAAWLVRQDWAGPVFADDRATLPPGVLPRSLLLADHARAAPILFTLRGGDGASPLGLPGVTLYDGSLKPGGGTHGGLLASEMAIVLALAGGPVPRGIDSATPAGLCDIAPTMLALLGLPGAEEMDGRVLREALAATPDLPPPAPETHAAEAPGYRQRLLRTRLGRNVYIDEGLRD